ncbi:Methyl-accepting chemotaxis protein (MCP) signalling domain-containing protein [Cohaesibacter sp. ES.047]|uniref:methyl-accepting chemotaxis protein n=1 Tax=Cohaesibacter sp. ES.047 TaxID=1798205 RepID=UPI000BB7A010|nr:HAMP domain-containing methyl-accepting chemotaxis protein [Cohaesibacter sp. ES.047]SNY92601.1 Methyl-accepting chemotaxis protein (MCP) signalling domain-containing protein [Cohaesibacter sp. ES.047]
MKFGSKKASIRQAIEVCKAVARGDFEARILNIPERGETAELMDAINEMIDRTDAYIRESKACLDYVSRNQHFRLIAEKGMIGNFKSAAESINKATYQIKTRHDGFCEMGARFETDLDTIIRDMTAMINELQSSSQQVSNASNSAKEQSLVAASGAEEASTNMQSIASSVEQLSASIAEINTQVVTSSDIAHQSVDKSRDMSGEISGLATASQEIGDVIALISDIAAQTNLLALNATIEAARAGEAGKGFAIVAQEVKSLSTQTANATEQIGKQIDGIQAATSRAVRANDEISATIERVSEISAAIAAAVEEQSSATREIANNVEEAANGTRHVSSGITEVNEATAATEETAKNVLTVAERMAEKEESLDTLRKELLEFLVEVRRVG